PVASHLSSMISAGTADSFHRTALQLNQHSARGTNTPQKRDAHHRAHARQESQETPSRKIIAGQQVTPGNDPKLATPRHQRGGGPLPLVPAGRPFPSTPVLPQRFPVHSYFPTTGRRLFNCAHGSRE